MLMLSFCVNQRLPSGPAAIDSGSAPGNENSVMTPAGVIRPMRCASYSVNQRLPSDPVAMLVGEDGNVSIVNSSIAPAGVIRPILLWTGPDNGPRSTNQRLPSGPFVI